MADDLDKSEKASPEKLREAAKKGQVSKSAELNAILGLVAFSCAAYAMYDEIGAKFLLFLGNLIVLSNQLIFEREVLLSLFQSTAFELIAMFILPVLAITIIAICASLLQTGFILSSHPIKPDFTRLNPVKGMKKLFSMKIIFELFKVALKLSVLGTLIYYGVTNGVPSLLKFYYMSFEQSVDALILIFFTVLVWLIVAFLPISFIDLMYTQFDFAKNMRMSKKDIKDEHKRREGDPQVKAKQKKEQKALLEKSTSLAQVKDADVIVLNPTHIAVALRYRPKEMRAPVILAMGAGSFAEKIRHLGLHYQIPQVRNKSLARSIFKNCKIGGGVDENLYKELAPIYQWLYTTNSSLTTENV
ncbi:MAG: EscU/YscU/HrcU family type III secretion system export apparatus switch protein [Alteromonadaceae bacterium]|nr:EscU/YscU/HrcU family type III secretion system export apparatus switch protein [Alteromonadaceae bacterium]